MRLFLLALGVALLATPARAPAWMPACRHAGIQACRGATPKKEERFQVPYQLTVPKHIMVRAKINGKGPFNFILDTGAPALFVTEKVAEKAGVTADKNGWGTFDRFEVEGGVVYKKAKGRVETPFQLEGMNGMGLAGAELHGIIGYNMLAPYRMEIDFTKDKMTWTKLDFTPKAPMGLGNKVRGQGGLEIFGSIMKMFGAFLGRKAEPEVTTRGFLGVGVAEDEGIVVVKNVLEQSPAAEAGLRPGDRIVKFNGRSVYGIDGLSELMDKLSAGKTAKLTVERGKGREKMDLTVKAGEGL